MSTWKRRWWLGRLAPALAAVAVAVPGAAAYPVPEGPSGGVGAGEPALAQKEATPSPYHYRNHRSTVAEEVGAKIAPQVVAVSDEDGGFALPASAVVAAAAVAFALVAAGTMAAFQRRIRRTAA